MVTVDMEQEDVDTIFEIARIAIDFYLGHSPKLGAEIDNLDLGDQYLYELLDAIKARQ